MPIRLKRRKSHSRPAYPSGLEIRRGPDITAKIDGELKHTESASGDSGLQDHQQHEVTEEFDVNTGFTGLVPGDRAPQSRQQQEASAEININVGESGYASRARAPQASQNENTAAAPDIPAFSSIFYDSRYLGSETRVKPQKWLNPLSSIGKLILTIQGHNIWEAEGPAQEAFHKLDPVIGDYLTTHMTTTSRPLYRLFMTGQTADTARPTILFYFINANLRKDARSIRRAVKRSGILDRYPGFKIDQSSRPNKYTRLFPEAEFILPQTHPHDGEIESQPSSPMFPGWQSELGRSSSLDSISQRQRNTSPPEVHEVEHMFEEVLTSDSSFSQESLTDQTHHVSEETVSKLTQITRWFTDKIWPTPQGSQRLWYLCGCGRHTYIDVKEIEPGGVESVRQNIMKNAAAVRSRPNHPQGAHESSSPLATPSPVHPVSSSTRTSPRIGSTQTRATALPSLPTAPLMNTVTSSSAPPQDMHLLVCVAAREFQTLAKVRHVDIAHDWNDGMLLRALLREYEEARRGQQWSISSLLPALPAKLGGLLVFRFPFAERTLSGIRDSSIWDVWRNLVPDGGLWAPLHMPSTADFVKFHVFSQAAKAEPYLDQFECGQWPSSADPYLYEPVPMRLTTLNIPLWHELKYPGPHLRHQWYNAAAKKLDGRLFDDPFPDFDSIPNIVGYGIRINERLNDVLVLWWCWVAILITGLFVIIFARYTGDNSSAFGLEAYLVAALTVYIQLQYAWWRRGST